MWAQVKGFSLIELMITIAIVGVLAGMAIPSYQSSVEKSRRSDARVALLSAVAQQERHFSLNNIYSNDIADIGSSTSGEGFYTITVAYEMAGNDCSVDKDCYTVTATAIGAQAGDTQCGDYTINNLGQKTVTGTLGKVECW